MYKWMNILILCLVPAMVNAGPKEDAALKEAFLESIDFCRKPGNDDTVSIVDDGFGKALVTYYNNVKQCSFDAKFKIKTPLGIEVEVEVIVGKNGDLNERIIITPTSAQMMSFPSEESILDGETAIFIIMGGLA